MSTFVQRTRSLATTVAISITVAIAGQTRAATLDIADVPLFLQTGVQPNLIMAIDDSGSMDFEVLLPGNDGAAWFRHGISDGCGVTDDNSFVGCIANGTGDVAASGKINFNNDGNLDTDARPLPWEKYPYLFPNGTDGGSNSFKRRQPPDTHYALPPLPFIAWARSPVYNTAYFDPTEVYLPWRSYSVGTFANASFTAARFDPIFGTSSDTINLSQDVAHKRVVGTMDSIRQVATSTSCADAALGTEEVDNGYTFQVFTGMTIPTGACIRIGTSWEVVRSSQTCRIGVTDGCDTNDEGTSRTRTIATDTPLPIRYYPATFYLSSPLPSDYGYTGATLSGGKAPDGSSLVGYEIKAGNFTDSAKYNTMAQNFANWFTYYRKRHQALRGGLGESFKDIAGLRIDSFNINDGGNPNVTVADIGASGVRDALFTKFYQDSTGNGGTPNRYAVSNMIRNFRRSDASAPVNFSCQRNFGMLFTDGFTTPGTDFDALGNVDGAQPDPFKDNASGTMADGVLDAYQTPLRTGAGFATGRVSTQVGCPDIRLDCNKNLHMNFYAVTLGTRGLLFNPDANPPQDPFANAPAWPTVFPQRHPSAVDDLWHATINGRGQLLNARRPGDIAEQLSAVLTDIAKRGGSASAVAVNSGSISDNARVFQAKFDSTSWSGQLLSLRVDPDSPMGALDPVPEWDAGEVLPQPANRKIITTNSDGTRVAFTWDTLDAVRKSQINPTYLTDATGLGIKRVNYLRGDASLEAGTLNSANQDIGIFRKRPTKLGDIITSSPLFVGKPPFSYTDTLETGGRTPTASDNTYSQFRLAKQGRTMMVYAGANDGMLHGFDASTGIEKLAYIPTSVFVNLRKLSDRTYNENHKYFVDGAPGMGDVFYDGAWHTILVGGLNKGGQGIYALDITDPSRFADTGNAGNIVRWEFTDANDHDLGFTYSQPAIVRLQTGVWAAIFGNGYNNTATDSNSSNTGNAVLYIVNIKTGALIKKFDTLRGSATNTPNGLSTPAVVDVNGDSTVDFVYAGDLYGNLWKFDISNTDSTQWGIDYGTSAAPAPLFTTQSTGSPTAAQPITGRPEVIRGPGNIGTMVLFGTGKYLETSDKVVSQSNQNVQSYYGIVDRNTHTDTDLISFGNLTQQQITAEPIIGVNGTATTFRTTTNNSVGNSGWYMNLLSPSGFQGERQVSLTTVRAGRVIFSTLIPDTDPCSGGGSGFVMELDSLSGARLKDTPFDVNRDGVFDGSDFATVDGTPVRVPVSGVNTNVGIPAAPGTLLNQDGSKEFRYVNGSTGLGTLTGNPGPRSMGRQSWRRIR
jgi:type IV pilus assembly protein PilY1